MTSQDALFVPDPGQSKANRLVVVTEAHLQLLRDKNVLRAEHELLAAAVLHLATIAGSTTKGYAAAQVFRELREAIAALPTLTTGEDEDDLAAELESLGHGTD